MIEPATIFLAIIIVSIFLALLFWFRPEVTAGLVGRILAFLSLFIFPVLAVVMGTTEHIEKSKTTSFCLSCHEMKPYGKSLYVNDSEFLSATHFQNNRVPRDKACFTCHTDYTLYGDMKAKMRGLRHVYVHYLGEVPKQIRLYNPYNNRECLHCHGGARNFEEGATHNEEATRLSMIRSNKLSCLSSNCHNTAHAIANLRDVEFWQEKTK